jgi:hypothetical protein
MEKTMKETEEMLREQEKKEKENSKQEDTETVCKVYSGNSQTLDQRKEQCQALDLEAYTYMFLEDRFPIHEIKFSHDKKYVFICTTKIDFVSNT